MRSFISSAALTLVSLLFTIGVFEVACRTIVDTGMHYHLEMWKYAVSLKEVAPDPAIGHQHRPNTHARLMGVDVTINSLGLRDSEDMGDLGDGTRLLMLGDSITFGWGVPQNETVAERLEASLTAQSEKPVSVINSGVGNYNTAMQVAWFEQYGLALNPDVVVLNVFVNDAEPTPRQDAVPWWDKFFYSRVILFGALDTVMRTTLGGPDWKTYYRNLYASDAEGWRQLQQSVARLAELCHERNIPLVIVDYPELRELSPYPFADVSEKIAQVAAHHDVPYYALLPAVETQNGRDLWVTEPDPHPNSYAAGLFADYLTPRLLRFVEASRSALGSNIDDTGVTTLP